MIDILYQLKKKYRYIFSKKLYLSFGENCLTDNILDRYNIKSFTTVYSHGRSNIEYIIQIEKDNYKDFLNTEFIKYEELNDKQQVPRLKKYDKITNSYYSLHTNGFEFTHHDVIGNEYLRIKFKERIDRLKRCKGSKEIIIFYHHRYNESTNMNKLLEDLSELGQLYSKGKNKAQVVLFCQKKIGRTTERKLEYKIEQNIHIFMFNTLNIWAGDDPEILWAKCDNDLIEEMIAKVKEL
ncbi:hypothetical protein GGR21_001717 [Dysgonomonas hofstadii]|uniref:Papain-like cysteine peptidase n=1 Tax=Dysgonomonas hofstadii TaxID=637886 RepID=A0A840CTH4_9BACT|nr:DUF1796 family putative cysteine peptidase [Dysgonomonas hofstadii]MBB4035822.1 hypothetical protein [Dysgonomonas hofstadii]